MMKPAVLPFVLLSLISLLYVALAVQYALQTPAWQVPDEPAHYNYIRQIAEEGRLPVIRRGDWDSEYQNLLTSTGFDPRYTQELARIEYEDHQPPLYYLLASPLYLLFGGDLTALRLLSVLLGLGVVLASFAIAWALFPQQPWIALATSALVAFIPQHLAILSGVNNDALAELVAALTFLAVVRYWQAEQVTWRASAGLGLLVGVALLTKSTIYFLAGIVGVAVLWRAWRDGTRWQSLIAFLIPALLLGGLWWGRNLAVYGGTDFLGLQAHDEVAAGQLQTDDYIQNTLQGNRGDYWRNMAYTAFHSFWGQFGWMAVPMETRVYRLLLLACLVMLLGSGLYAWQMGFTRPQREYLAFLGLTILLVVTAFLYYNLKFVQFQGRYLYPALIPLALWGALGLTGWAGLASRWWPPLRWGGVWLALLLAGLAWFALTRYLVPNLPNWG